MELIPSAGDSALDVGARDGYLSLLLAERFRRVTALDLNQPKIEHERVVCVKGNITSLEYPDDFFDVVLCAEVLEHIPPLVLEKACSELLRVTKNYLVIGVPYRQDIRLGRTTCYSCGNKNPPWGHVNTFDERRLMHLFEEMKAEKIAFSGTCSGTTNFLSCWLMDLAGNPYGEYTQNEPCIHCGAKLVPPPARNLLQKVFTRCAVQVNNVHSVINHMHPNWIHIVFSKPNKKCAVSDLECAIA